MFEDGIGTREVMETLIADEIRRLVARADVYVIAIYASQDAGNGLVDFRCEKREPARGILRIDVSFDYEGIGVWYICRRNGDTFHLRHILVEIRDGKFVRGQAGEFDGYWEDFPAYLTQDRWVGDVLRPAA